MTRLSNRQYPVLKIFMSRERGMTIHEAQTLDQRPFRSLLIHQWLVYSKSSGGFVVTKEGAEAWEEFHHTNIKRHDPLRPLTSYFDPSEYRLKDPYLLHERKIHVINGKGRAHAA